jgi:hypothetical protein
MDDNRSDQAIDNEHENSEEIESPISIKSSNIPMPTKIDSIEKLEDCIKKLFRIRNRELQLLPYIAILDNKIQQRRKEVIESTIVSASSKKVINMTTKIPTKTTKTKSISKPTKTNEKLNIKSDPVISDSDTNFGAKKKDVIRDKLKNKKLLSHHEHSNSEHSIILISMFRVMGQIILNLDLIATAHLAIAKLILGANPTTKRQNYLAMTSLVMLIAEF